MSMATPPRYLLRQVFPPFTLPRTCSLPNSDLDCTPLPLPLFNIFSGNSGSLCCKLCPCTPSKPACRLQYVTWTWHHDPASPMPQNVNMAKTPKKEKSYKKYLESQCSDQWRKHLELTLGAPPGRVRAYVHWHLHNTHKRSMYKPCPIPHPSILPLPTGTFSDSNSTYYSYYTHPPTLRIQSPSSRLPGQGVPALYCQRHNSTWT